MKIKNKFICWLWTLVWKKYLWDAFSEKYGKVTVVKGWRTATVEWKYKTMTITPCFWIFK